MGNVTIPLAKTYDAAKCKFPALISEKLDGVPIKFTYRPADELVTVETRQGEPVPSVMPQVVAMAAYLGAFSWIKEAVFVAEVKHETLTDFKDVSGVVRRQTAQQGLILNIFDGYIMGKHGGPEMSEQGFYARFLSINSTIGTGAPFNVYRDIQKLGWDVVEQFPVHSDVDVQEFMDQHHDAEGAVVRYYDAPWSPGKRRMDYQKVLHEPTIDLWIVGCMEAKSKDGEPLGMAGRLIAKYKGDTIGVGPGKLTHEERVALLEYFRMPLGGPTMAQIKYKKDDSYEALRQPTFQFWRNDKTEADA